jgi:hypothetical protein
MMVYTLTVVRQNSHVNYETGVVSKIIIIIIEKLPRAKLQF